LISLDIESCVVQDMANSVAEIQATGADEWSLKRHANKQTSPIRIIKQIRLREIPLDTERQEHFVPSFFRVPSGV